MIALRAVATGLLIASLAACGGGPAQLSPTPVLSAQTEWTSALVRSSEDVAGGRHAAADKLLADFSARYPASAEAVEAMYWRAIVKLDPANSSASPRDAAVLLDGYLASTNQAHRLEAATLRRLAGAGEARGAASVPARTDPAARPDDRVKDDEILRLRDELARANAELERIKRRLAQPKP